MVLPFQSNLRQQKTSIKKIPQKQPAQVTVILDEVTVNEWTVSLLLISLTFPSMKAHFLKVQAGSDGWFDIRLIGSYLE